MMNSKDPDMLQATIDELQEKITRLNRQIREHLETQFILRKKLAKAETRNDWLLSTITRVHEGRD